jgi:hypothetical protein
MKNQSYTPINSLNFDEIKTNFRDFLRGQEQFKDYDFEGSTLSILLDLLAYNTHYQAYYANMVANETFIDSAVARDSVVSLAKHLNYTPRSMKAAQLVVDVILNEGESINQRVIQGKEFIPYSSVFKAKDIDGNSVNFVALNTFKAVRRNGENIAQNVVLHQGSLKDVSYVANTQGGIEARFTIPDRNIDIDTLEVRVQKSQTDTSGENDIWSKATDINKLDSNSLVFFVQMSKENRWEIYFGDGILGKQIENGNMVSIRYLVTNGSLGNGIGFDETEAKRSITSSDIRVDEVRIKTDANGKVGTSFGGMEEEGIESIRYYAPRNYQAQDRAVTVDDYKALLGRDYSDRADTFFIWGGEENDPPQYGKLFISIKPKIGNRLSASEKQAIEKTILGEKNLVTITPEVVDPDLLFISPKVTVYYNESATTLSSEGVANRVLAMVRTYGSVYLGFFERNFRLSNFTKFIDNISPAIYSNQTSIFLTKNIEPTLGRPVPYTINFDNPLLHPIDGYTPILSSTVFGYRDATSRARIKPLVDSYLEDDGYGNVQIYKQVANSKVVIAKKVGTINYQTGVVFLRNFSPEYLGQGQTELRITVSPKDSDIFSRRNQIILFDDATTEISAISEKTKIARNASDASFPR